MPSLFVVMPFGEKLVLMSMKHDVESEAFEVAFHDPDAQWATADDWDFSG